MHHWEPDEPRVGEVCAGFGWGFGLGCATTKGVELGFGD